MLQNVIVFGNLVLLFTILICEHSVKQINNKDDETIQPKICEKQLLYGWYVRL